MKVAEKIQNINWKDNKYLWFGISLLIILALAYYADVRKFIEALTEADFNLFLVALVLGFSSFFFWGLVWHSFFKKLDIESNLSKTLRIFLGGNFLNAVTPLGQFGGEPFLAYIISRNTDASYEKSFSCVVSADIINGSPFITYILAGVLYLSLFGSLEEFFIEIIYLVVFVTLVGGFLAYSLWFDGTKLQGAIFGLLDFLQTKLGRGEKYVESLKESVKTAKESFRTVGRDPKHLLKMAAIAHISILAQIFSLYFILLSININPSFTSIYFIVTLSSLATFSPTPGGSGTFEAGFSALMMLFYPVELAAALTAAVLFRLTTYWPGLLVGYFALLTLGVEEIDR